VAVRIGLLGVTLKSFSSCENGSGHKTGKQGAAMVIVPTECTNNVDHELQLQAQLDSKGVLDGAGLALLWQIFVNLGSWIFLGNVPYIL
jgi:hypothetical protein